MDRQVLFRDRQELQADDLTAIESFTDRAFGHVISDAISIERSVRGMAVTQATTAAVSVAPGRLWVGDTGQIYTLDAAQQVSLFAHLPAVDTRWVTLSTVGAEQDTDSEPRDFLIDLQTGETEPSIVAMERARVAQVHVTVGIESSVPQKPTEPTGYVLLGYVLLDPNGIVEVQSATNRALPNLHEVSTQTTDLSAWRTRTEPKLASMASDIADLAKRLQNRADRAFLTNLAADVGRLKEVADLPDDYSDWAADHFLDTDESDLTDIDWYARVEEGIRFPWAGQTEQQLALFNPLSTAAIVKDGLLLPAYDKVARLTVTAGYAGELSISQYQSQTHTLVQRTLSRQRRRYGPTRRVCTNSQYWHTGRYDPLTGTFTVDGDVYEVANEPGKRIELSGLTHWVRLTQYWIDSWDEVYWEVNQASLTITGAQLSQTFLQSQNGWLVDVLVYFTRVADSGTVYLHLCETQNGVPDINRCIGSAQLTAASLSANTAPGAGTAMLPTTFSLTRPVYLEAGKRYALVLTTTGDHYVAVVSGTEYTQGTLFYSMDAAYYQGDYTKDLMMEFHYASFRNPRTTVELTPLSLSGGLADIDLLAQIVEPDATQLLLEYQKAGSGAWYPINEVTTAELIGLPALLNLRVVFIGTTDLMPGLGLSGSRLLGSRPATEYKHFSALRTLTAASTDIRVTLRLEGWDGDRHTLAVSLVAGEDTHSADSSSDLTLDDGSIRRTFLFTPDPGIDEYQIVIEGTTDNPLVTYHVAERVDVALAGA